jgi:hypothetical protein
MQGFMSSISEVVTGDKSLDKLYVEANNLKNKISNENSVIYFPYVKSSGIGMTVSHDQNIALGAIRKKLDKLFKDN